MSGLFDSQVVSLEASQKQIDPISREEEANAQAQIANSQIFLKTLDESLQAVNKLVESEKEDPVSDREEEDQEKEER